MQAEKVRDWGNNTAPQRIVGGERQRLSRGSDFVGPVRHGVGSVPVSAGPTCFPTSLRRVVVDDPPPVGELSQGEREPPGVGLLAPDQGVLPVDEGGLGAEDFDL